jgi:hypothetical protein
VRRWAEATPPAGVLSTGREPGTTCRLCAFSWPTGRVPSAEGALYELYEEQEVGVRSPHHPRVVHHPDGPWVVECRQCRDDRSSSVPIGIGLPLADQLTAERLAENHAGPARTAAGGR